MGRAPWAQWRKTLNLSKLMTNPAELSSCDQLALPPPPEEEVDGAAAELDPDLRRFLIFEQEATFQIKERGAITGH